MRWVLDTATVVAAVGSDRGASRRLLIAGLERRFAPLVSTPLLLEYEAVLTRPEQLRVSGLSSDDVSVVLDALAAAASPVRLAFLWRPQLRDPDDDMVLETAVNGGASAIVTLNQRDFRDAVGLFGLELLSPRDAWRRLERDT